jgi:AraC-like DNA-binding protein
MGYNQVNFKIRFRFIKGITNNPPQKGVLKIYITMGSNMDNTNNMGDIYNIKTINELNRILGQEKEKHPLISIVDFSRVKNYDNLLRKISPGFYSIMLKNFCPNPVKYGRNYYDFQEGTLMFIAPGQIIEIEKGEKEQESMGWGLFFHPDLIRGTSLFNKMKDYSFFSYDLHEALHLSDDEKLILGDIIEKIKVELGQNIDKHSKTLIVTNIELLLNYCSRFYDRQFITRTEPNKDILVRFEEVISSYFGKEDLMEEGIPTVKYCAERLHLSPNYLSDLLKKETGKNAREHIQYYLIEMAKNRLLDTSLTVSEIAYELGFGYPQHFSKLFKNKTGMSPAAYRNFN